MNISRVDQLIRYAMAVACKLGFGHDELGPIHFIKYVYLADLHYAMAHGGETYTGTPWRFHKFGPWANEVFQRIEPALIHMGVEKKVISGKYEDDFVRWRLDPDLCPDGLERELPFFVTTAIDHGVKTFGADTIPLLHYVYDTFPMLHAAPGEALDFSLAVRPKPEKPEPYTPPQLSKKQERRLQETMDTFRSRLRDKTAAREARQIEAAKEPAPRYDEVFFQGLAVLDELAGEEIPQGDFVCMISPDMWKSRARYDPDLSD